MYNSLFPMNASDETLTGDGQTTRRYPDIYYAHKYHSRRAVLQAYITTHYDALTMMYGNMGRNKHE